MPAGADHITIGKKPFVVDGIDLACRPFFQKPILIELMIEVLRDLVILWRMRAAKVIEGKTEAIAEVLLDSVHSGAVFLDRKTSLMRGQFCWRPMFVGSTDE